MGWMVLLAALPWIGKVSATGVTLLLAGGVVYTLGAALFLLSSRLRFAHLVWHLFVMACPRRPNFDPLNNYGGAIRSPERTPRDSVT